MSAMQNPGLHQHNYGLPFTIIWLLSVVSLYWTLFFRELSKHLHRMSCKKIVLFAQLQSESFYYLKFRIRRKYLYTSNLKKSLKTYTTIISKTRQETFTINVMPHRMKHVLNFKFISKSKSRISEFTRQFSS